LTLDDALRYRILCESLTIAVVGCSADPLKPGFFVPQYLQAEGFRIVPVNPNRESVFGLRCHESLLDLHTAIDLVQVFRPATEAPELARQAVAIGARYLWLQLGIESDEARGISRRSGVVAVMDECMGVAHGRLGLGPGVRPPMPVPGVTV
jgi:uncharacterized protein